MHIQHLGNPLLRRNLLTVICRAFSLPFLTMAVNCCRSLGFNLMSYPVFLILPDSFPVVSEKEYRKTDLIHLPLAEPEVCL
jgi:hypothetical protein